MKTGQIQKFNLENGSVPMDGVLCFFGNEDNFTLVDGWLCCEKSGHYIQDRNSWKRYNPKEFTNYHEILNENSGFITASQPNQLKQVEEWVDKMITEIPVIDNPKGDKLVAISSIRYWLAQHYSAPKAVECVHPYMSVIGEENGCPRCLMCNKML